MVGEPIHVQRTHELYTVLLSACAPLVYHGIERLLVNYTTLPFIGTTTKRQIGLNTFSR